MKFKKIYEYLKNNLSYFCSSVFASFFVFLYQIFAAKQLDPINFGTLAAFNNLLGIICIPLSIYQLSAVNSFVEIINNKKKVLHINFFFRKYFIINFLISILYLSTVFLILVNFLNFLKVSNFVEKNIFYLNIFIIFLTSPFLILIQSKKNYFQFSLPGLIGNCLRFIFLIIFLSFANTYLSGLIANLLSTLIVIIFLLIYNKNIIFNSIRNKDNFTLKSDLYFFFKNTGKTSLLILYSILFISLDVIFFKELFSGNLAGYYAGISMISKIPLFLISILIILFYTESLYISDENINFLISKFLFVFFIFLTLLVFFLYLYGEIILTLIFNNEFSYYNYELIILSATFAFAGITKIIQTILISKKKSKFLIFNFIFLLTTFLTLTFTNNITNFCIILLIGFFVNFLFTIIYFYYR